MKKIIALILALAVTMSLVACGGKKGGEEVQDPETMVETSKPEEGLEEEIVEETEKPAEDKKEETKKPEAEKPQKEEKPVQTPEVKPEEKPVQTPEVKPEEKPEVKPEPETAKTLGTTLLADFKAKAASGMDAQSIADALLANPAIKFGGGAMPVEEGYLSGFDNAEIKGFKTGVMFAPMIGSIPFVGYIFELPSAADAPAFIANLEKNANKRWNICVEADEMVTGSSGNKVFFVMCPTSLEE